MIDWTTIITALIGGLPATIAAVAALIQTVRTHRQINSRMTELLETKELAAHAEGVKDEKERAERN